MVRGPPGNGHVVHAKKPGLGRWRRCDSRLEQPRLLEQRINRQRAAVTAAPDAYPLAIHIRKGLEVPDGALEVLEILAAPVHEKTLAERPPVSRAAAHIHLHHDVPALDHEL